jgi:hypothetical protein
MFIFGRFWRLRVSREYHRRVRFLGARAVGNLHQYGLRFVVIGESQNERVAALRALDHAALLFKRCVKSGLALGAFDYRHVAALRA